MYETAARRAPVLTRLISLSIDDQPALTEVCTHVSDGDVLAHPRGDVAGTLIRMRSCLRLSLALTLATSLAARADEPPLETVPLPFTLLDVPEAVITPQHVPTWEQALDLTGNLYRAAHLGLHFGFAGLSKAWWSVLLEEVSVVVFDVFMLLAPLPGTQGWAHEEGHRSAMGVRGIPSLQAFDDLFIPPGQRCDANSVCGMTDDQIAAVKDRRAADWVRVQAAGMETELELMRRLERDAFFSNQPRALNIPASMLLISSVVIYRTLCADAAGTTAEDVTGESPSMLRRDFTGPDCTGFVWDLFRPEVPYADRGPHPNGDGVRRIRLASDLSFEERAFLTRMRNLSLLNYVDPALFGFPRFDVSLGDRTLSLGGSLQHDLTAFGDAFGLSLMARLDELALTAVIRLYRNQVLTLPGVSGGVRRYPLHLGPLTVRASAQVELWLQPLDFSFTTTTLMPGAALEVQAAVPLIGPLEAFAALKLKSAGWRPADPFLDAAVTGRLGVNLLMPVR